MTMLEPMDRAGALHLLSPKLAGAIMLDDAGCDSERIAAALDIEPVAVPSLLAVAHAKLTHLMQLGPESATRAQTGSALRGSM